MKTRETFDAWLKYSKETLRLSRKAHTTDDHRVAAARDAEGQRLWDRCRAEGWTKEEGERALRGEQVDAE